MSFTKSKDCACRKTYKATSCSLHIRCHKIHSLRIFLRIQFLDFSREWHALASFFGWGILKWFCQVSQVHFSGKPIFLDVAANNHLLSWIGRKLKYNRLVFLLLSKAESTWIRRVFLSAAIFKRPNIFAQLLWYWKLLIHYTYPLGRYALFYPLYFCRYSSLLPAFIQVRPHLVLFSMDFSTLYYAEKMLEQWH